MPKCSIFSVMSLELLGNYFETRLMTGKYFFFLQSSSSLQVIILYESKY